MTEIEEKFLNANNELFRVLAEFGMTVIQTTNDQPRVHVSRNIEEDPLLQEPAVPLSMSDVSFQDMDEMLEECHKRAKAFVQDLPMIAHRLYHNRFCFVSEIRECELVEDTYYREIAFLDIA